MPTVAHIHTYYIGEPWTANCPNDFVSSFVANMYMLSGQAKLLTNSLALPN